MAEENRVFASNRAEILERCNLQIAFNLSTTAFLFAEFCMRHGVDPAIVIDSWRNKMWHDQEGQKENGQQLALNDAAFRDLLDRTTDELRKSASGAVEIIRAWSID